MPSINRIRFTNVMYDNGQKRYTDTTFRFDGYNGILLLENGAGKTVFVQTLIQAVLPRQTVAQRKIQETLQLNNTTAHIAVEWILTEAPRRYGLTVVSLFINSRNQPASQEFVMEYGASSKTRLDTLPLTRTEQGHTRAATKEELAAYFRGLADHTMTAQFFSENDSLASYWAYIESHLKLIPSEWKKITAINAAEGGVEKFFEDCRTTSDLVSRLLIPTVEEGFAAVKAKKESGNGFAALFEKQRDHFRQQLSLEKRIAEMKGVETALASYTEYRSRLEAAETALRTVNSSLKGLYHQAAAGLERRKKTALQLQERKQSLEQEKQRISQSLAALVVAEREADCAAAQSRLTAAEQTAQMAHQDLTNIQTELNTLRYARLSRDLIQASQDAAMAKEGLRQLSEDQTVTMLEQEKQQNAAALHFWFNQEDRRLADEYDKIQSLCRTIDAALAAHAEAIAGLQEKHEQYTAAIGRTEGEIRTLVTEQERMEITLFPDSMHCDPAAQIAAWKQDLQIAAAERDGYEKNIRFYTVEKDKLTASVPVCRKAIEDTRRDLHELDIELAQTTKDAAVLIRRLSAYASCANIAADTAGLYGSAERLTNTLGDAVITAEHEEDALVRSSRQAHRFLDAYEPLDRFSADPILEAKIALWKGDFVYLQSGADLFRLYCQEGYTADALYAAYPYWASAVITTAADISSLWDRLNHIAAELTQPVFLATEQEIRAYVSGEGQKVPARQVIPAFWRHLIPEEFSRWKEELAKQARHWDEKLHARRQELQELRQLRSDLIAFIQHVPFSEYQDLQASRNALASTLEAKTTELSKTEADISLCQKNLDMANHHAYAVKDRLADLTNKLNQAATYEELRSRHQAVLKEQEGLQKKRTETAETLHTLREERSRSTAQRDRIRDQLATLNSQRQELKSRPYAADVQSAPLLQTEDTYDTLADKRRRILSQLEGTSENRGRLESELHHACQEITRLTEEQQKCLSMAETVIDKTRIYPPDGQSREASLLQQRQAQQQSVTASDAAAAKARQDYAQVTGRRQEAEDSYYGAYEELISFTGNLAAHRQDLEKQRVSIAQAGDQCHAAMEENARQRDAFTTLLHHLEQHNVRLQFTLDTVPAAMVPVEWQTDAAEVFQKAAPLILAKAEEALTQADAARAQADAEKERFIRYCNAHLEFEKMRRRIIDGIRAKTSYADYASWNTAMKETIAKTIRLSQEERVQHAEHIEHMITHMTMYLREVCAGLTSIADKTRISTDRGSKTMITIHLPQWQDAQASTVIRSYLEDTSKRLDGEDCKDESGREDPEKIRAILEKRLRTQQLLIQVLGINSIKVKCRKATSSQEFSERPYGWEESNRWSGGEMWSKNMALFLGCLKYLAEKRCILTKAKYNTRVVIADNPFGKASSEHVLNPVFFIAQQLGFQILALTAHEDGTFIRNYFPVVYSCRLAHIAGTSEQVLVPEKQITAAFFEDEQPQRIERLTDYEEIGLF